MEAGDFRTVDTAADFIQMLAKDSRNVWSSETETETTRQDGPDELSKGDDKIDDLPKA